VVVVSVEVGKLVELLVEVGVVEGAAEDELDELELEVEPV